MGKSFLRLCLVTVLCQFGCPLKADSDPQSYYSNAEGSKIGACIRNEIRRAPKASVKSVPFGQDLVCQELMYLWDSHYHLNILVQRADYHRTLFHFEKTAETDPDGKFANKAAMGEEKQTDGYFSNAYLTGFFSHSVSGPAPHRQDYFTFNSNGYLLWEESTENRSYNLESFPSLYESPIALYNDYPTYAEDQKQRVLTYGVCYVPSQGKAQNAPCFN